MRKLIFFGAVVCLAAFLGSGLWPETTVSQESRLAAAGDSFLSIPACAFNDFEDGYDFVLTSQLYLLTSDGHFRAPVNLPNGSVIKKVILICFDNGGEDIELQLIRVNQSGGDEWIASVSSSVSDNSFRTFTQMLTSKKYVNTWKHSHLLNLYLPGTDTDGYKFSQAKIVYTPPS